MKHVQDEKAKKDDDVRDCNRLEVVFVVIAAVADTMATFGSFLLSA